MYCCAVPVAPRIALSISRELFVLSSIRTLVHSDSKQFAPFNLRVELALAANVGISGRIVS